MKEYKTLKECQWQLEQTSITAAEKIYWKQQEFNTMQEISTIEKKIDKIIDYKPSEHMKRIMNKEIMKYTHSIQNLTGFKIDK